MSLIRAMSGSSGGSFDILEMVNTSSGCTYSSSGAYSGYPASGAFDCNLAGSQGFYPESGSYSGVYLRIDLGASRHIKAIGFGLKPSTHNSSITHVFDVQYGSSYITKERKTITFPANVPTSVQVFPIDIESQYIGFSWVSCDNASSSVKIFLFE